MSAVEGGDLTWSSRSVLSEEELSEPLAMLYEFGHVRDSPSVYAQAALRAPRVLLGTRTALVADREARPSKSSAVEGSFHLVVEGEDPSSGIRFVRTYFLCCNALPPAALREASLLPGQTPPAEVRRRRRQPHIRVLGTSIAVVVGVIAVAVVLADG